MNTAEKIKEYRLKNAWSQEQLAQLASLSVRTIQRIERGQQPGLETLSALASVFEVPVSELSGFAHHADKCISQNSIRRCLRLHPLVLRKPHKCIQLPRIRRCWKQIHLTFQIDT